MTKFEAINIAVELAEQMRDEIPYDTGNMALHAFKYEVVGEVLTIEMDVDQAPYVGYTNEPWISAWWRGKKNPNEGWWNRLVDNYARRLAERLKGDLK